MRPIRSSPNTNEQRLLIQGLQACFSLPEVAVPDQGRA
jgi:hypothetical protein